MIEALFGVLLIFAVGFLGVSLLYIFAFMYVMMRVTKYYKLYGKYGSRHYHYPR